MLCDSSHHAENKFYNFLHFESQIIERRSSTA